MLKALIVDDDISVIRCFEKLINWKETGYDQIYTAINGSQAYDIAVKENVDVIISDLKMPVMGGVELARKLRENNKNVEIILLTAYEDFTAAREGIELKIYDYLLKPLVIETIERLVVNLKTIAQKKNSMAWIDGFIKDEFDKDIIEAFRTHNMEYFKEIFDKVNILDSAGEGNQIFQMAMVKMIGALCAYLSELGFLDSSIKSSREKLLELTRKNSTHAEIADTMWKNISSIINAANKFEKNEAHTNVTAQIKKYIEDNYMKYDFSVSDISEVFHYSQDHINRIFKNSEGITASKYIINLKMEKAKQLILESSMTVNEVAKNVGYNSLSYFISSFKNFYQITPAALRERNRNIMLHIDSKENTNKEKLYETVSDT